MSNTNFNNLLNELWSTSISQYLNENQYSMYEKERDILIDKFNRFISQCNNRANDNRIITLEKELSDFVNDYNIKNYSELDARIELEGRNLDGPSAYAVYGDYCRLRDFCNDYPDIAIKYIELNGGER